jgi:hypothetical protein
MKKTSIYLEIILKSLNYIENVSFFPCFFRKNLRILIKASVSLKMSSKSFVIFIKACNARLYSKQIIMERTNRKIEIEKPQNNSKCLTLLKKASIS